MAYRGAGRSGSTIRAGVLAGLLGGAVFFILQIVMAPLFLGASPWQPVRMIAAIITGPGVLAPPPAFELGTFVTALVVNFVLAIIGGVLLSVIIRGRRMGTSVIVGILFGLSIFLVNFYIFTALFPWFTAGRNWPNVFAHLAFGAVAGWCYAALQRRPRRAFGTGYG